MASNDDARQNRGGVRRSAIDLRPATDRDVREFVAWRYEPPYDVYTMAMDPGEAVEYFLGADIHCHTLVDGAEVVGFCTFGRDAQVPGGDYTVDALDVGLGVKPSRTGSGPPATMRPTTGSSTRTGSTGNDDEAAATMPGRVRTPDITRPPS